EERGTGASRRVHGRIRHRDADEVNQRECKSDRDPGETHRRSRVRGAENHDQEHECHDELADHRGAQRVAAGRMLAVPVRGEPGGRVELGCAARDDVKHGRGNDPAENLSDDIRQEAGCREASAGPQSHGDGWIEMRARYRPQRIGTREHREAERESDAREPDPELRECRGEHGAAAAAEYEPEGAEKFGGELRTHLGTSSLRLYKFGDPIQLRSIDLSGPGAELGTSADSNEGSRTVSFEIAPSSFVWLRSSPDAFWRNVRSRICPSSKRRHW